MLILPAHFPKKLTRRMTNNTRIPWAEMESKVTKEYEGVITDSTISHYFTKMSGYMNHYNVPMVKTHKKKRPQYLDMSLMNLEKFEQYFKARPMSHSFRQHFFTAAKKVMLLYADKKDVDSIRDTASEIAKEQRKEREIVKPFTEMEKSRINGKMCVCV